MLDLAQEITKRRLISASRAELEKATRNLIMVEDFELENRLNKHAKAALAEYDDLQLASLVAHKRLTDFKDALARRNVRSIDSYATYGWIICQDAKNADRLGEVPCFEALFAGQVVPDRVQVSGAS